MAGVASSKRVADILFVKAHFSTMNLEHSLLPVVLSILSMNPIFIIDCSCCYFVLCYLCSLGFAFSLYHLLGFLIFVKPFHATATTTSVY